MNYSLIFQKICFVISGSMVMTAKKISAIWIVYWPRKVDEHLNWKLFLNDFNRFLFIVFIVMVQLIQFSSGCINFRSFKTKRWRLNSRQLKFYCEQKCCGVCKNYVFNWKIAVNSLRCAKMGEWSLIKKFHRLLLIHSLVLKWIASFVKYCLWLNNMFNNEWTKKRLISIQSLVFTRISICRFLWILAICPLNGIFRIRNIQCL